MNSGLITVKDIQKRIRYPRACKDHLGRLRVGAAIGVAQTTWTARISWCGASTSWSSTAAHGHSKASSERPAP